MRRACLIQRMRAFASSCAGCNNIVYQQQAFAFHIAAHTKRSVKIDSALARGQLVLIYCVKPLYKQRLLLNFQFTGHSGGYVIDLIESALHFFHACHRHIGYGVRLQIQALCFFGNVCSHQACAAELAQKFNAFYYGACGIVAAILKHRIQLILPAFILERAGIFKAQRLKLRAAVAAYCHAGPDRFAAATAIRRIEKRSNMLINRV